MAWFKIHLPWPLAPIGFPITEWIQEYNQEKWWSDVVAGLTVFVFLIPQGMAYALLAGLPPVYGLYTSIVPLYIYAIFGTSQQLSMGPFAITSLLLGVSTAQSGYDEQTDEYVTYAMNVSMVVGFVVLILGLFRLGTLANLISPSVLTGFLTASAVVISLNQVKYIFGFHVPRQDYTVQTVAYILVHLEETNLNALALGLSSVAVLYAIKLWRQNNKPTPEKWASTLFRVQYVLAKLSNFLAIVLGSVIAYGILQGPTHISIVGSVPSGLQTPTYDPLPFTELVSLIPSGLAIAFVAFASNWAVAKKYSMELDYEVDATQELLAEGLCVIIGVFFNAFVASGGLSRSAVNAESGAMTQITGCIVATLMIVAVLSLTMLFYYIPMCVLAAIIQVSVISMADFTGMYRAYQQDHPNDAMVMIVTFLFTLFLGITEGLFVGIFISIAVIIYTTAFPSVVHLGKLSDEEGGHFKNLERFKDAHQFPGVSIIRMDSTLFFGNAGHFKDMVLRSAEGVFHSHSDPIVKVVIDASCWIDLDLTAVKTMLEIRDILVKKRGIAVAIACAKGRIRDRLEQANYLQEEEETGTPLANFQSFSIDDALRPQSIAGTGLAARELEAAIQGGPEVEMMSLRAAAGAPASSGSLQGLQTRRGSGGSRRDSIASQEGGGQQPPEDDSKPDEELSHPIYL